MTHLGSRVSALVDGRLGAEEEERCWAHVHACHTCRDLVEHEGWVKTQLARLSYGASQPSHDFKSALVGRCSELSASGPLAGATFPTAGSPSMLSAKAACARANSSSLWRSSIRWAIVSGTWSIAPPLHHD